MNLEELLQDPTARNYLAALDEFVEDEGYDPFGSHIEDLQNSMVGQEYGKVLEQVRDSASTLMLSPVAHHYAAKAAEAIGDDERAQFEQLILSAMMQAILATGDGTRDRPYVVSIMADELAVCGALKLSPAAQSLDEFGGRVLDVLADEEGRELVFDVTRIYRTLGGEDEP